MAVNVGMRLRFTGLALLVLACAWCALPTLSGAQPMPSTTSPALQPSGHSQPVTPAVASAAAVGPVAPSDTTAVAPTTTAAAAAAVVSKKIPLPSAQQVFEPAAEVASALPVPIPETFPSASGFGGFDPEGYGGQTVPGGGLGGYSGGYNGGYGGYCCGGPGGFGYGNGLGYNNFFNSAPATAASLRLAAMAVLAACVFAMF